MGPTGTTCARAHKTKKDKET